MTPFEHALQCAGHGWAVFPAGIDKIPRTPNGHKAASTDPIRIKEMHAQFGFILVGIATGEVSDLAVLDVDRQHGGGAWWQNNRHRLPITRIHRSRSGGLHAYFRHRPGLRCSTSKIAGGIDIRGQGGSIIFWPATGLPLLCDAPLAEWPDWLTPPPRPSVHAWAPLSVDGSDASRNYASAALRSAVQRVAGTLAGGRNAALNAATFGLTRFIVPGVLSPAEVAEGMTHAGLAAGLDQREVIGTITSALRGKS
jgi:hypothetical protein